MFSTTQINSLDDISKWDVSNGEDFTEMFKNNSKLKDSSGIDNWKVLNDYEVSVMSELDMFREGTVRIPDQLMEYFGCDRREKRVMFLFEGRE